MTLLFVHETPGWYGIRLSRRVYLYTRDRHLHPFRYGERTRNLGGRRHLLVEVGNWSLWLYIGDVKP